MARVKLSITTDERYRLSKVKKVAYIDPDTSRSGVCISEMGVITKAYSQDFIGIVDDLLPTCDFVVIEAGWLNVKSNYRRGYSARVRERQAHNVGMNHMIGKLFEAYCKKKRIDYELYRPTTSKYSFNLVEQIIVRRGDPITNIPKNQDVLDAIAIALSYLY